MRYLYGLLALVPLAIVLKAAGAPDTVVFVAAAVAMVPLSALLGRATDDLAVHSGPRVGGLINVTLGNAAELIIAIVAVRQGLLDLARASLAGSILANVLLVLGASLLTGGIRHGRQQFDAHIAGISATMMALAVVALVIPAVFSAGDRGVTGSAREGLSIGVAMVLLVIYGLYVLYTAFLHEAPVAGSVPEGEPPEWSPRVAVAMLAIATAGAAVTSEILVGAVQPVVESWGVTELFLGVMLVPLIGNAVEQWAAVRAAARNRMDLSLSIAIGSSLQVALFVTPVLVLVSLALGHHLQLEFDQYELTALAGAAVVATFVSMDGESNWVEGAQLLSLYLVVWLAFMFLS